MREPEGPSRGRRPCRRLIHLSGFLLLFAFAACEIPTEPPAVEQRWIVPADETRFGVSKLLPSDVTLNAAGTAFVVDFDPVTFSASLGSLCAPCAAAHGLTVPKPAFLGSFSSNVDFPPQVHSVTVVSGQVALTIRNDFNFDPIRPAAGVFGRITVRITDSADGDLLGTLVIDGTTTPMPPGTALNRTLSLGAATVNGGLLATVQVDSPLGDAVTMNASLRVTATATPSNVLVSAVAIDVRGRVVDFDAVSLDVEDIDDDLVERIVAGGFRLRITNPFGVGAAFQLTIDGPTIAPIQKGASIGPATAMVSIAFTAAELRSFLGEPGVVLSGRATVDPAAPIITVRPGQELVLSGELDLTIRIGGGG
jgi:hypothetical protein